VIDDQFPKVRADLLTQRRLDPEFVARLEPEVDIVEHLAGHPAILGHPGHRGKANLCRLAAGING
jgi:hypothetical protein